MSDSKWWYCVTHIEHDVTMRSADPIRQGTTPHCFDTLGHQHHDGDREADMDANHGNSPSLYVILGLNHPCIHHHAPSKTRFQSNNPQLWLCEALKKVLVENILTQPLELTQWILCVFAMFSRFLSLQAWNLETPHNTKGLSVTMSHWTDLIISPESGAMLLTSSHHSEPCQCFLC